MLGTDFLRRDGLWRNPKFVNLWAAATVSTYGSLVTCTALPFAAILLLDASPSAISLLRVAELLPGFVFGLVAGAWVDRLRRRPIMIATDLGRALLIVTIPLAAFLGLLGLGQLYAIAALVSVLSVFFDVAYQSYLPSLVKNEELVEANSKLSAAMSVAEASAFSSAGWLIQILTAPIAMMVDAVTFVASAGLVARIPDPEAGAETHASETAPSIVSDVAEGLRAIWNDPILRGMVFAGLAQNCSFGLIGTVFLLYVNQEIGFDPGILGMIFAVGGVSSFLGAMIAGRLSQFGVGSVMVASLLLASLGDAFVPLATAANIVGVIFLVAQQLVADSALTVYDINQVSLRQAIAPAHVLGRVNASVRVTEFGAVLLGTVVAGYIGETFGLRQTLWLGVALSFAGAMILLFSPVRDVQRIPETVSG
ncbi:MAG: MFS transporter [Chloroflexia bacterium]|nr:MFS transporter [Chloroflexia bacterium]